MRTLLGHSLLILLLVIPSQSMAESQPLKLVTKSYTVILKTLCEEGEVTCDQVEYQGRSHKTGASITLMGKTVHSLCADKLTPCRFLGYEFKNGDVSYTVTDSGLLRVTQGEKLLLQQQGEWQ